ncbi:NAD-dependent epimerase/dehydratase family protein [Bacillus sp. SCS-153A]|uniref:NAD-dependent epimerase/dehydratase family protein n=1 Tax=Rossellomorea sedimentorum TaxID=3115294 RepID=UPI003906A3B0
MSKAIVTGGLGFIGFELCLSLLEEGMEVVAADSAGEAGERWLEVGRNANITYQPLQQQVSDEFSSACTYINLYDHFTGNKTGQHLKEVLDFVERNRSCMESAVILLPSVLSSRINEEEFLDVLDFLGKSQFNKQCTVYLPTLFGPHQPESFLFQQICTNKEGAGSEYVDDSRSAIFVKDAAAALMNIEQKASADKIQFVSDIPDSWEESLQSLGGPDVRQKQEVKDILPAGVKKVVVTSSSSVNEVMESQRNN